jgi:hypothetical protein
MHTTKELQEAQEFLNEIFDGKGVEIKIIKWNSNLMYKNSSPALLIIDFYKWKIEKENNNLKNVNN